MSYSACYDETLGFTTRQLHAGYDPAEHNRAKTAPVYQTAVFELGSYERGLRLFEYAEEGHSYVRFSNPTNTVLEKRISSLEGGSAAVSFASGMAGISSTILNLAKAGDEIVSIKTLYGGSTTLFEKLLPDYGIHTRFVEHENDPEEYRALINEKTKAVYVESLGNPGINIVDLEAVAAVAHEYGVPVVVDNTFATPYLFRPFEHGADIVCYSATKFLAGHGTTIAGLVVEKGDFNWRSGRFPQFDKYYADNVEFMGEEVLSRELFTKRLRQTYLTDLGAHMSPTSAFLLMQGIETLSLRMRQHVKNAQDVAEFLEAHPAVKQVNYPGLKNSPYYDLSQKYFPEGPGAILSIRVNGGLEGAKKVVNNVKLFDYMVNVGDAKSLIVHSASTTHYGQSKEMQEAAGVYEDTLRLSIGIEDTEDLINDLRQALES
ncbi:MAG: O-acetylhomoserine aminocarboxypropyltransferase/cysteine synthase [Lachnospiraceae bacterium]|nr:O-acetylhomoserine aminocarboxypropyltransferase/cysteine synthase [Lachnospiraceae bacterium]